MLILDRRPDEAIVIGDDVIINVISVFGNIVKLGIDAPKEISVHREEIWMRIQREIETEPASQD